MRDQSYQNGSSEPKTGMKEHKHYSQNYPSSVGKGVGSEMPSMSGGGVSGGYDEEPSKALGPDPKRPSYLMRIFNKRSGQDN